MTLSEKDLTYFRERTENPLLYFLLPILCCRDITWNKPTRCLMLAGKVFARVRRANGGLLRKIVGRINVAKKFQLNGGISEINNTGFTLKINKHRRVMVSYFTGYYHSTLINKIGHVGRKRLVAAERKGFGEITTQGSSFYDRELYVSV